MKKDECLLGFLVILSFIVFGCAAQEAPIDKVEPAVEDAVQEIVEEPVQEPQPDVDIKPIEEDAAKADEQLPIEEKPKPVVEKFQMFDPVLTYDGAYNGPLYGTSEQVGSASMGSYFELLDKNGINFFIGMFGISGEPNSDTLISGQGLGEVIDAAQKHPYRIIPFFNPGIGGEEVEQYLGEELTGMYSSTLLASKQIAGTGFIRGFGEVETQEWDARHNDPKVRQLIDLAKSNNLHFMFHPVASKISDVEKIVEAYPDTIFLVHMYREDLAKSMTELIRILTEHGNIYFSMDAAHILFVNSLGGDLVYVYDSTDRQSSINKFVSTYDSRETSMINDAIKAYRPLVDAVPDKVMWGTEIGPEYAFDPKVFDRAVKISRFVIAGFDEEDREAVGYRNALRVFGEGVVADAGIKVIDTSSWPECSDSQMSSCDGSCEIPDEDSLTPKQDECYQKCLIHQGCKEVLEMDIG